MQNALLAAAITLIFFALLGIIILGAIYMPLVTLGIYAVIFTAFIFGIIYFMIKINDNGNCKDF